MMRLTPSRTLFATLVVILLLIYILASFSGLGERGFDVLANSPHPKVTLGETCSPFSSGGMNDVTIIIKFGAPEVASKLPPYLKTFGQCKPDLLLFSDRKDSINGIEIVDALANLNLEYKYENPDFEIYDRIQLSNHNQAKTSEGWRLDKYKFLPMMELTANLRPDSNWFVFIELDTYVNWDNLYRFLSRFNSQQAHYFGSPVWPKNKPVFAHGGSGFVLSHGALRKLVARGQIFAENNVLPGTHLFGENMQEECCGDEVLAKVLKQAGVRMKGYWPMFNGETPSSLPFGHEQWCEAIVTLHHLGEEGFDMMRRLESTRQSPATPLTFKELFGYIEPSLASRLEDWSNMSEDVTLEKGSPAGLTFTACYFACLADSKCVQCEHFGDTCRLSHSVRLGHNQTRDAGRRWTSGWVKGRIESFKAALPNCDGGAHIVHSNP